MGRLRFSLLCETACRSQARWLHPSLAVRTQWKYGLLFLSSLLLASPIAHADDGWRLFVGRLDNGWRTDGTRGHTEDCRTPKCDDADWRRGNLDASIGVRVGADKPLLRRGRLSLLAGVDSTLLLTEYNLSQREVGVLATAAVGTARYDLGDVAGLLRLGAGLTVTDDGRLAEALLAEAGVEVEIGDIWLRLTGRTARYGQPRARDLALSVVMPSRPQPSSDADWLAVVVAGGATPGAPGGSDLQLSDVPFVEIGLRRRLGDGRYRVGASFETTAWESRLRTVWFTTPGNERSRSVDALALAVERQLRTGPVRWLLSASAKIADFSDPVGTLLRDDTGRFIEGGDAEPGAALGAAVRIPTGGHAALLVGVEHELWPDLDLAVLRFRLGIEVPIS
jgi:hypothetical protein